MMKRALVFAVVAVLAITAVAIAYPPATITVTSNSVTIGNLDCGRQYQIRVREWRAGAWRDSLTYTPTTAACPTPTPTPSPTATPTPTPTPTATPTPTPTPPPGGEQFPTAATAGVPAGWQPAQTRTSSLTVSTPGAVVEDVLFAGGADLFINAPNVTVRNVKLEGGWISTWPSGSCHNGTLLENVTITRTASGVESGSGQEGVVSYGGYTARNVEILNRSEGFRSGGESGGCTDPTVIEDSYVRITPPDVCGDWHGDGIQGYDSAGLKVRNTSIELHETGCGGTAPFFYQGGNGGSPDPDTFADIDGLLLWGGGHSFRIGTPGAVRNVNVINNSWGNSPTLVVDAGCGALDPWDVQVVEATDGLVTSVVRDVPCG